MLYLLAVCILGIYTFFLSWGILQERITTIAYVCPVSGESHKFTFFIVLNFVQSLGCVLVAGIVLWWQGRPKRGHRNGDDSTAVDSPASQFALPKKHLLLKYLRVSVCSALASPFGYLALKHINYPTMILGKSCKLLPVMLMNFLLYKRRFERYKYASVFMITVGVAGFMFFKSAGEGALKRSSAPDSSSPLLGFCLLMINLLIDGATNSWQDKIFLEHRPTGQQMMFYMQGFSALMMLSWLTLNPWTQEFSKALAFIKTHPAILPDIFLFAVCGALGQVFVFYTLERWGSLVLVTVTVTRKLFTILISLCWFDHRLVGGQWASVALVFAALFMEAYYKRADYVKKKTVEVNNGKKKKLGMTRNEMDTKTPSPSSISYVPIPTNTTAKWS